MKYLIIYKREHYEEEIASLTMTEKGINSLYVLQTRINNQSIEIEANRYIQQTKVQLSL